MKVVAETPSAHALTLELEGVAGTEARLRIVRNRPGIHVHSEGATLTAEELVILFPPGHGYRTQRVRLSW